MKSMDDENSRSNNNGWLGFSLSPYALTMEASSASHHHHHQNQAIPSSNTNHNPSSATSFFNTQALLNYTNNGAGLYYGVDQGENGGSQHFSMLPVMPLKSDGTLCIMQGMLPTSSTPKLEDFFGSETMGPHHYENHDREAMALGMDNMFYHHEPSSQGFTHPCYTAFKGNELVMHTKEQQQQQAAIQVSTMADPHGISGTWTQRGGGGYSLSRQVLEQKMTDFMGQNGEHSGHIGSVGYGDLQSLSLSMSPSSQSSCVTASQHISPTGNECLVMESRKRLPENVDNQRQIVHRKSLDTFGQRTSQYRGVTRHRWTGRYEAHLWDNSCKKEGQSRKGRQVYLGGYDSEEKAARAYDQAALKYWGPSTHINFPLENYQKELEDMKNLTRQEYVAHLRRNSSGFSRGASIYRGVTRHHQHGRWQARIGRVAGNKDLYLGTFSTQEEAAEAYDIAAIKFRGINAVTNFDIARYDVEKIMASNTLLASDLARRNKEIQSGREARIQSPSVNISSGGDNELGKNDENESDSWKMIFYQSTQPQNTGCGEQHDQNRITVGNDKVLSLPMAEKGLAKIDRMTSIDQQKMNDSAKIGTHVSDPSSLVTSLGSSREGSPDKANLALPFTMPPSASWLFTNPAGAVTTWLPSVQLRHGAAIAQMPLFAAWADS